jgi:hypothetical protein
MFSQVMSAIMLVQVLRQIMIFSYLGSSPKTMHGRLLLERMHLCDCEVRSRKPFMRIHWIASLRTSQFLAIPRMTIAVRSSATLRDDVRDNLNCTLCGQGVVFICPFFYFVQALKDCVRARQTVYAACFVPVVSNDCFSG